MSTPSRPVAQPTPAPQRTTGMLYLGVGLLLTTGLTLANTYYERRAQAEHEEAWRDQAERLTAAYEREAAARDRRDGPPRPDDPLARNHRDMARLLGDRGVGREAAGRGPLNWALVALFGVLGVGALASWFRTGRPSPEQMAGPRSP